MSSSNYDLSFRDWSGEMSNVRVGVTPITAITIVATNALIATLRGAIEAITIGVAAADKTVINQTFLSADRPASPLAQREIKWLVRYHGVDNNKKWSVEIPTAQLDLAGVLIPDSDFADLTVSPMSDFVTAFEAAVRPPDSDTSLVVIDSVQFVGRNL